jgi:hypothetical protein
MKRLFFLAFLFPIFLALAEDDWIIKNPPGELPLARFGHALAYIGDDKILCYGGNGGYPGPYANDTWLYDLSDNIWSNLNPPDSVPSIRRDHAMAYIGNDNVLLFGGYYPGYLGDTWLFTLNTNTWTQLSPSSHPGVRYSHEMCYIGDDKVLLHGGVGDPGHLDDMWIFDLSENIWTQVTPVGAKPSPRHYHKIAEISENKFLLYGGYDTAAVKNDTWIYDLTLNIWIELVTAVNPLNRYQHTIVSIGNNKVMLYGGRKTYSLVMDETWVFNLDDTSWTKDINSINPPELYQHMMSQTCLDGTKFVVLFGGASNSGEINETWTFGGGDYITDLQSEIVRTPSVFSLNQNFPNPFNPSTRIQYQVSSISHVALKVYDILGNEVATLVNEEKPAGRYEVEFQSAVGNRQLASGIYFYQLKVFDPESGSGQIFVQTKKMLLIK